jgi:hypothetical protein
VATPPDTPGTPITTGKLYRLIPNWTSHWDKDRNQPKDKAFRRDGDDDAISMLRASHISIPQILAKLRELNANDPLISPHFGICEFQTEALLQPPPLPPQAYRPRKPPPVREVYVEPRLDETWGDAHVVVLGVSSGLREWLYGLGKLGVVKAAENIIDAPRPS